MLSTDKGQGFTPIAKTPFAIGTEVIVADRDNWYCGRVVTVTGCTTIDGLNPVFDEIVEIGFLLFCLLFPLSGIAMFFELF